MKIVKTLTLIFLTFASIASAQRIGFQDPDAYVDGVRTVDGKFTQIETDLIIASPVPLGLSRIYDERWTIAPHAYLIVASQIALTGEPIGGMLKYKEEKVVFSDGMVNTYAEHISGQTNLQNNRLICKEDVCEIVTGNGTKRTYEVTQEEPLDLFLSCPRGLNSKIYRLNTEELPNGNQILYSYENGNISLIEMKDQTGNRVHAWIRFQYRSEGNVTWVEISTSDERKLVYHLQGEKLIRVNGSHCIPVSYEYENGNLTKIQLPEGRYLQIEYDESDRVKTYKNPSTSLDEPETIYRFEYGDGFTDVFNALGVRTRRLYDENDRLIAILEFNKKNELYRETHKYWEGNQLVSLAKSNGQNEVLSLQAFKYDAFGNIESESLYGNLSGEREIVIEVDADGKVTNSEEVEFHVKKYKYSADGLNLLKEINDVKKVSVEFNYRVGRNQLESQFLRKDGTNLKRVFYSYDLDGACTQIIEDDGYTNEENDLSGITERRLIRIDPKKTISGWGLPEVIESAAYDLKLKKMVPTFKIVHSYDLQGALKSSSIYGSDEVPVHTTSKTYTNLGQVKSETDPEGSTTFYDYDQLGNLILITSPHQNRTVQKRVDVRNRVYEIIEKSDGIEFSERYAFDCLGNCRSLTDRFGSITIYDYDEFCRLHRISYPQVCDQEGREITPTLSHDYNLFNQIIRSTDLRGDLTVSEYTIRGDPSKILYPDGTNELFKYDLEGSLHRSLTRDRQVTVHEYDDQGRILYQETSKILKEGELHFLKGHTYEYNAFRLLGEKETGLGELQLCSRFYHDPAGRIIKRVLFHGELSEKDRSSRTTEYIYDGLGRIKKVKKWFGDGVNDHFYESYKYTSLGEIKEKSIEDAGGKLLIQRTFDYDCNGNCVEESSCQEGRKTSFFKTKYDPFGEVISYTDAAGNKTTASIDYTGKTLRKILTDPLGTQTELEFDRLNRLISSVKKDSRGTLLASEEFGYDAIGNRCFETHNVIFQGNLTSKQTTRWVYGPMSRLEEETYAAGSPDETSRKFTYDQYGRLKTKTLSGTSAPVVYSYYTKTGRLSKIEHISDVKEKNILNTYEYDLAGNIHRAKSINGIDVERDYNVFGEVIREKIEYSGNECLVSAELLYKYDRLGRVKKITLPDQSHIKYSYDGIFGRWVKRTSSEDKLFYEHSYDYYNDQGELIQETTPFGSSTKTYDRSGRKTGQRTELFSESVPEWGYNPLNCLVEVERKASFSTQNGLYAYDLLSQLSSENTPQYRSYQYDSVGNVKIFNGEESVLNNLNQAKQFSGRQLSFDSQGNLSLKIACSNAMKFTHNILGQCVLVEKEDGINTRYLYDPFGRRIVKESFFKKGREKVSFNLYLFFYLLDQELGALDSNQKVQQLRVPGIHGFEISQNSIAIEIGPKTYIPLHDIAENVIALIDPHSKIPVESYAYSAFGERIISNSRGESCFRSPIGNPWGYKGKRLDDETRLIHFGLRSYDPETHRWTTPDPLSTQDGPNLYCFLHNNPITCIDRQGLSAENSLDDAPFQNYFYGEVEKHCFCETHRSCKRGGDIGNSRLGGVGHGVVDFVLGSAHDLQTMMAYMGLSEIELTPQERALMIGTVEKNQTHQVKRIEEWMMDTLSISESDPVYRAFRANTLLGLEVGSLLSGGYGAVKGIIGFSKLARMPRKITQLGVRGAHAFEDTLKVGKFTYSNTAASHITDIVKKGENAGRLSRPYMKSPITVNEIMSAGKPIPDPGGISGGLRWDIPGTFRGSTGTWELVLHPEREIIYHFNFK